MTQEIYFLLLMQTSPAPQNLIRAFSQSDYDKNMTASTSQNRHRLFAFSTIIFAIVGWIGSWELATEYVKKLKNPEYVPNCDFSLLVTCGPNMESWQGSVFGFSNTFLGLGAFVAPLVVGAAILSGAKFNRVFWALYLAGLTFGIAFVFWLSIQSVFYIGTLCPWCMVVWLVTIPLFWFTLGYALRHGYLGNDKNSKAAIFFGAWALPLTLISYAIIACYAQIALDWISHLL